MLASLTQWLYDTTFVLNILIFLVIVGRKITTRWLGANWCYALWLVIILKLILPPLSISLLISNSKIDAYLANAMPSMANLKLAMTDPMVGKIVLAVWLTGFIIYGLYLLINHQRFIRKILAKQLTSLELTNFIQQLKIVTSLKKLPQILQSAEILSTTTIGIIKPKIILANDFFEAYDNKERNILVQHELMHIKRHDLWLNSIAQLIRALFWFNPFIHLAYQLYRVDQEHACDESLLQKTAIDKQIYGALIEKTIPKQNHALPASTCIWYSLKQLKERVALLGQYKKKAYHKIVGPLFITIVCASTLIIAAPVNHVTTQIFHTELPIVTKAPMQPAAQVTTNQIKAPVTNNRAWTKPPIPYTNNVNQHFYQNYYGNHYYNPQRFDDNSYRFRPYYHYYRNYRYNRGY